MGLELKFTESNTVLNTQCKMLQQENYRLHYYLEFLSNKYATLKGHLKRLVDLQEEDCRLDHNGFCQNHLMQDDDGSCPIPKIRKEINQ